MIGTVTSPVDGRALRTVEEFAAAVVRAAEDGHPLRPQDSYAFEAFEAALEGRPDRATLLAATSAAILTAAESGPALHAAVFLGAASRERTATDALITRLERGPLPPWTDAHGIALRERALDELMALVWRGAPDAERARTLVRRDGDAAAVATMLVGDPAASRADRLSALAAAAPLPAGLSSYAAATLARRDPDALIAVAVHVRPEDAAQFAADALSRVPDAWRTAHGAAFRAALVRR
jgi:hypothetical protein